MTSLWQEIQYSLRVIAKAPGFAAIAILTLALGIGANTTIFSWINSSLLNPVPGLASPSEVVALTPHRCADVLQRCDLALHGGALRLLYSRAARHKSRSNDSHTL